MHWFKTALWVCCLTVFLLIFFGCGSKPIIAGYQSTIPEQMQERIGQRWRDGIWAVGTATGPEENVTVSKATANARAELARQFRAQVDVLERGYDESVNHESVLEYSEVKEIFATLEITGSRQDMVLVKEDRGVYSAKVLLVVSAQQFKSVIDHKLNAYTSFKAQEAYEELQARVEREQRRLDALGQ